MFQFIRRVSGSLLPRPDRPWKDDATSHAPTIGHKRRYSVTEQDVRDAAASTAKKMKTEPVRPGTEHDPAPERESPKQDAISPVEGREVKEVTKGVEEVDLEDKDKVEDIPSIRPEGVPLPDSPSGSPEPSSESPGPARSDAIEERKDQEHGDDEDSVASSTPEHDVEEEVEVDPDASADGNAQAQGATVAAVESGLHDSPETLVAKA